MAILLTLLTFLLFISISYYHQRSEAGAGVQAETAVMRPVTPELVAEGGVSVPRGYRFHPGHTWALEENGRHARIGLDGMVAELVGAIERIDVAPLYGWVRQGQRLWTIYGDGFSFDMVSPVEGKVVSVNTNVIQQPSLIARDPYGEGWILVIQAPFLETNLANLVRTNLVRAWIQDTLDQVRETVLQSAAPGAAYAQDGGFPAPGLLSKIDPELRERLVHELFLT